MKMFLRVLKEFLLNSSFHGLRFLAERSLHWTEKVFWFLCCLLSWYASGLLLRSNFDDYQHNAVSFVVETNYLEWNTTFPSISLCETDNSPKIAQMTDRLYGSPHDYNLDEIVKELVFYKGLSFYTLQTCASENPENPACKKENFEEFDRLSRSSCEEMFGNCRWNNETFDCCSYFVPIPTEIGICYVINSVQTRNPNVKTYDMISNKKFGPGTLYLEVSGKANLYILGGQEVPSLTTLQTDLMQITPHVRFQRKISINEIENMKEVKDMAISQRNCRFLDENAEIEVFPYYSYSVCCIQCRKNAQLKKCGCAHHLMPNTPFDLQCHIDGLECLSEHYNELSVLKAAWSNKTGLICDCLPSCTELEMTVVKEDKNGIQEDFAVIEINLDRLPSERYKRNVIKGKLDLVVSMGGTVSLFIGASVLTFVEIGYYFIFKPIADFLIRKYD